MTFALLRHGQTDWNRDGRLQGSSDIPLNATGRAQALRAAETLAAKPWAAIVSSPLARARESATLIAGVLGIDLGPAYPELVERDYGALEGTAGDEARRRWPDRNYPGAETLASVVARGRSALDRIADDFGEADVVIVGHGTLIRFALAALAGHAVPPIDNGTISTLRQDAGAWTVLTVNGLPLSRA